MADKGFNTQDLLALHDTVLTAPPMMRKNNVSARASTATRRVATTFPYKTLTKAFLSNFAEK